MYPSRMRLIDGHLSASSTNFPTTRVHVECVLQTLPPDRFVVDAPWDMTLLPVSSPENIET